MADEQTQLTHDQQMAAAVDARQAEIEQAIQGDLQPGDGKEQQLIAGKFNSVDDLAKAYKELESKLGTQQTQADPVQTEVKEGGDPQSTEGMTEGEAQNAVESVGMDFDSLYTEFATTGTLSDESYEKLNSKGIPPEVVNAYIEGQSAKRELIELAVKKEIGGEEEYNSMISWASKNLTPAEVAEYNKPMTNDEYRKSVDSLYGKYVRANGQQPNLVGATGNSSSVTGYQTKSDMMADINSAKYKKDPGFRKMVQDKLAISSVI